jgi:hypothetical protein
MRPLPHPQKLTNFKLVVTTASDSLRTHRNLLQTYLVDLLILLLLLISSNTLACKIDCVLGLA